MPRQNKSTDTSKEESKKTPKLRSNINLIVSTSVRQHNGNLEWYDHQNKKWILAVYHDDVRDELIQEAAAQGSYKFERAKGNLANDVTSYFPAQRDWGTNRADWPDILHKFEPKEGDLHKSKIQTWMMRNGKVLLDINENAILNYPEIPAAVSSKYEPPFMEAVCRSNHNITIRDIRARMLRDPTGDWNGNKAKDPIRFGTLGMAMTRFRAKSGLLSWAKRQGTDEIKQYLQSILPQECKDANSTRGFRDLYPHEMVEMRLANAGNFPERSRRYVENSEERKDEIRRKATAQAERLKKKWQAERGEKSYSDQRDAKNAFKPDISGEIAKATKKRKRMASEDSKDGDQNNERADPPARHSLRKRKRISHAVVAKFSEDEEEESGMLSNKRSMQRSLKQHQSLEKGTEPDLKGNSHDNHGMETMENNQANLTIVKNIADVHERLPSPQGTSVQEDVNLNDNADYYPPQANTGGLSRNISDRYRQMIEGTLYLFSSEGDRDSEPNQHEEAEQAIEENESQAILYDTPTTQAHREWIQSALGITGSRYLALTAQEPPATSVMMSYMDRLGDLQMYFEAWWISQGNDQPAPILIRIASISSAGVHWNDGTTDQTPMNVANMTAYFRGEFANPYC